MDLKILELEERYIKFEIKGITPAIANALRRTLINDIPKLAIHKVIFHHGQIRDMEGRVYDSSTPLFDEIIAHRLGLIPLPTDLNMTATEVEQMYIDDLKHVKSVTNIPVAVKLSPFFTSFANVAKRLDEAGADGLVLFNRFYQPDIDLETLDVVYDLEFSTSYELRLPLRWIAILYGKIQANMAATSGIHTAEDVLKAVMVGADVAMIASVLFQKGPRHIERMLNDIQSWMEAHEYESIEQMKGSMSLKSLKEPAAYMRANYMKTIQSIS